LADLSTTKVTEALKQKGFELVKTSTNVSLVFDGALETTLGQVAIQLSLSGPGELPKIRLLEMPESLKPIAPHINANGILCYAAEGTITLDIFDWPGQTLACLDRATEVLNQILAGEMVQDLAEEFYAYWTGEELCLLDFKKFESQGIQIAQLKSRSGHKVKLYVMTDDLNQAEIKLASMGYKIDAFDCPGCMISTKAEPMPMITGNWPPKNVSESPTAHYAAVIQFSEAILTKEYKKNNSIIEGIYASLVLPLSTFRIDEVYMAQRNQPNRQNLIGKKIILIGCGTIGGYLAELLVKSGAGSQGGRLILSDYDLILPGNIGRHRLGVNAMFKNKAIALTSEINRAEPTAKVESNTLDARELNLDQFDLIINATGEQSLSDELSLKLNAENFRPIIHCWIEGPGIAVRTMLQDQHSMACYRCLYSDDRAQLYPATTEQYPIGMVGHGCESLYVPFSANISLMAAALAAEHIMDWANETPQPRLRTMITDRNYKSENLFVDPLKVNSLLLGYRRGDHLEVTHATEPTKYDIRKIFSFKRNSNTHTEIANKAWSDSKGHICYIGEWHTHPEDNPTPSGVDIREWKKLSMNMEGNNSLFMLIVGRKSIWTGISSSKGILKVLVEVH